MSNKIYTSVPVPKFPRNVFSLSRPVVGSMRMQRNYPTEIIEIVPGDALNLRQETFLRTAPLVAPPLAKVTLSHHAFFVPCWQLHEKFDDFITGGEKMDFHDHMPYTTVGVFYHWIYGVLINIYAALNGGPDGSYAGWLSLSSDRMEEVISLIEMLDYSRAVPFYLPEFQPVQVVSSSDDNVIYDLDNLPDISLTSEWSALADIAEANVYAFIKYNPLFLANSDIRVNLLPIYAYLKVWCEYFRDENLVDDFWDELKDSSWFSTTDRLDEIAPHFTIQAGGLPDAMFSSDDFDNWIVISERLALKKRAWRKDRFTSALPWTQKGPDISIPISGTVPVSVDTLDPKPTSNSQPLNGQSSGAITTGGVARAITGTADLSEATGMATMRDLRRAEAVEEFEEADGRFGNRYPENTLGQFGVYTPDSRLPRAQFLGSARQVVSFGEIPQTSETGDTPLGTLAGKGTSYSPNFLFKRRFTMHGFVIIMTSIQVSAMYEQGIHPMFSRFDRTEYAWPRYARLGEEPIYAKELSIFGENVDEDAVFGYAPRYSTYKSDTGSIHGQMKTTLNYWTFSRKFPIDKDPTLSKDFIYNDPRRDAFAVTNPYAECFYFEIDWKVRASRLLPFYGVPSI